MAKIKMGAFMTDISGKSGGHVFAKNKGGAYVRTKSTVTNPQSSAQMLIRGIFASISSKWSALTESSRESWNGFVSSYARTDVFGDLRNPTGKALYQRLNNNLAISGQALITECVSPLPVPFADLSAVAGSVSGSEILVNYEGNLTGTKLLIFATPSLSQGTKFVKNKLRLIAVVNGANGADQNVHTEYVDKFGAIVADANIYFGVKVINSNGQASPLEIKKSVIAV